MRVAVLFEYDSLNGGERSWLATVPHLQSRGVALCAVAPCGGDLGASLEKFNVHHIGWPSGVLDETGVKRSQRALRSQLADVISDCQPDLVHANSLSMARTLGPLARQLQVPCIGHLRDILRLKEKVIGDLNGNHRLLAVSEATRQFHVAQGLDGAKTHLLYNGVDTHLFRPNKRKNLLHRSLGIPDDDRLIATIGQIGMRKGLDLAMDALQGIFELDMHIHWVVIGQRHSSKDEAVRYAEMLVDRSKLPPFAGRVHWLGTRDDVPELLASATLLLHAARQEPLGRVLLEAATSECPVVATNAGGTTEIFGAESTARIVPVDDPVAMHDAIVELLENQTLSRQLGAAARQRVASLFSAERAAESLLRHYEQVASY